MSFACAAVIATALPALAAEPRPMEFLDRGTVAIAKSPDQVFVSWRLLGTEPLGLPFNVYRTVGTQTTKLNDKPLTAGTWFLDEHADASKAPRYTVRAVVDGREQPADKGYAVAATAVGKPYLSLPMKSIDGYMPNDCSAADLDGDGQYEIIVHQHGRGKDNSQAGETDPPILQAYKLDGTLMWSVNLGKNIREGAHYTQFMVYDFDGDGKAELMCKTADGTTDARGKVIGDANANYVDARGFVLKGPEYLTVFDGVTGAAVDTVDYLPNRNPDAPTLTPTSQQMKDAWGDGNGNRMDRFLACVAYLDGKHPSAVFTRGYYTRTFLAAYDYKNKKLTSRWVFDSNKEGKEYAGQGNHNLSVADVDNDGKDEIVFGGMVVDDNGKGLFSTGYGHGDAIHVGDLDPSTPGLEMFRIQERFAGEGAHMVSLKTGKTLWAKPSLTKSAAGKNQGPGRGLAADVDPRYPGFESWAAGAGVDGLWDAKGNEIGRKKPTIVLQPGQGATFDADSPAGATAEGKGREVGTCNFRVYWDGDTLDELLDKNTIAKWDWQHEKSTALLTADGCVSNNGTKSTPALAADLLGDWREEVIWPTADGKELRIYSTTIPTDVRLPTLMHDPEYRLSIAWQNVGYNQPAHLGYSIEQGAPAPKLNITTIQSK